MSFDQDTEQGARWEQIEEALHVIKGLTESTGALKDWLNGYTTTFEPVWDALHALVRLELLQDLQDLPRRIAQRRKEIIASYGGVNPYINSGLQQDDLPPIQSYVDEVKKRQSNPWLAAHQRGIATSSRSDSSRFRPVNRKAAAYSPGELDEKLDKLVLLFPCTSRKYSFREAAQNWVDCYKRRDTYRKFDTHSFEFRQRVFKQLDGVPAELARRRKRKISLYPWLSLPSLETLGEDPEQHSRATVTAPYFQAHMRNETYPSALDRLAAAAAGQHPQWQPRDHHQFLPGSSAFHAHNTQQRHGEPNSGIHSSVGYHSSIFHEPFASSSTAFRQNQHF